MTKKNRSAAARTSAWSSTWHDSTCACRTRSRWCAAGNSAALGERPRGDLQHAFRNALRLADALERRPGTRLAPAVELPPAVEAARHARRDLRVDGVERDHLLCEERVAGPVGCVEAHLVAAESANQGV